MSNIPIKQIMNTPDRRQSKMLILSKNIYQKSLETEFLNVICRVTNGNQKHTVSNDFYLLSLIVKSVFDCHLPGVMNTGL